jgi:hypothetical protein
MLLRLATITIGLKSQQQISTKCGRRINILLFIRLKTRGYVLHISRFNIHYPHSTFCMGQTAFIFCIQSKLIGFYN